jgi:hypothetical protein
MSKYCTSLAAEFFVLSALNRLQQDACLTLGNAKGVDILLIRASGESVRVEVKGVAGKHDWPADNIRPNDGRLRFYVLSLSMDESRTRQAHPRCGLSPARQSKGLSTTMGRGALCPAPSFPRKAPSLKAIGRAC